MKGQDALASSLVHSHTQQGTEMNKVFYMVKGPAPCLTEHATLVDAETEAISLSSRSPGTMFFVMKAEAAFVLPAQPVHRLEMESVDSEAKVAIVEELHNAHSKIAELEAAIDGPVGYVPWKQAAQAELIEAHKKITELQAAVQGPTGYGTWQEAAEDERIKRVALQRRVSELEHANLIYKGFTNYGNPHQ